MLLNCYGPTEATIWATSRVISPTDDEVAIGAPLPGYECHLFDQERRPVTAAGQVGELYIGGLGVARGYLNRAELTAAAFVPDPRGTGRRLYRTGDLARCRADGTLVCLGRIDSQVKLRGYRIELGEIEAAALAAPGVTLAAVLVRTLALPLPAEAEVEVRADAALQQLILYVTPADVSVDALRATLRRLLPAHAQPNMVLPQPRLPTNAAGKLAPV